MSVVRGLVLAALLAGAAGTASGARYWFRGTHGEIVTVCFVGDAVTSRPSRVQEILGYLREFENSVNVRFDYLGPCPASQPQSDGSDAFAGDIRVVLPDTAGTKLPAWTGAEGTGPVPGAGCPMFLGSDGKYCSGKACEEDSSNDGWGSWSNAPDELAANRACLYNLKLGDDPWDSAPYLNHALHEFGHALGLAHEHTRKDADRARCAEAGFGGRAAAGHLTPYDRQSVMHYTFATCGIDGNYGYSGLSDFDRIGLRILYPEANRHAEYVGATVLPEGKAVALRAGWGVRGANLAFVAGEFEWTVNGAAHQSADLSVLLPPGEYAFHYSHSDFLGRHYSSGGIIRVLPAGEYARLMAATRAAQLPLY